MSNLTDLSAGELVALVARGEASCVEVVEAHLDRIDALNPRVNAIVGLRDRAAVLAEAAERDRATTPGPLHGLLGDGVASSTRPDPQAKGLGEYLRSRVVDVPEELL